MRVCTATVVAALAALGATAETAEAAQSRAGEPPAPSTPVVVRVSEGRFHWTDAAIGAAGGFGLAVLSGAVVAALRGPRREE